MRPVIVLIFHAPPPPGAGPLVRALAGTRRTLAEAQMAAFTRAGADAVELIEGPSGWVPFGRRLAEAVRTHDPKGAIVMGSGSIPLARPADLAALVEAASGPPGKALANNRYSADVVAISGARSLAALPDLPADNALPRWLEEHAGMTVSDLRDRWDLAVDLDTPADLVLMAASGALPASLEPALADLVAMAGELTKRVGGVCEVVSDRRAELLLAGRLSSRTLAALGAQSECRIRALIEERGLRASSTLAQAGASETAVQQLREPRLDRPHRPPRSILGRALDADGPAALGSIVAELGDAAAIDTRVLLAHRLGPDERAWPSAEDRFASDLLLADRIDDPWLRALTQSALDAQVPIVLGGHSLLNGSLRLLLDR